MTRARHILSVTIAFLTLCVAAQPQATWLERNHDFGVFLEKNGKVHCAMRLVNTGNEPLIIVKAQAGCGCTGITYPESPIPPGDTACMNISYNPSGRPGQFNKQVMVFTNTVPQRTMLEITGNVIPTDATLDKQYPLQAGALRISQGNLPFGEILRGQSKTLFLSAYNASTDTIIAAVDGTKAHIHPAIVPDTVPPGRVTALTVHYLSGAAPLWGFNVDSLVVTSQALGCQTATETSQATILVMAQVLEDFKNLTDKQRQDAPIASTDCGDRLDFGVMARGETASRTFTVTNRGKDELIIRRLWVPMGNGVTIKANKQQLKRGKTATVTVTINTADIPDELLNVPLTLMCNNPDTPLATIRLVGIID